MNSRAVTTDILLGIVPIALMIALWQALVSFGYAPPALLPPPGLVFTRLAQQLFTTTYQQEIAATLFRLFAGFSIAVLLGVLVLGEQVGLRDGLGMALLLAAAFCSLRISAPNPAPANQEAVGFPDRAAQDGLTKKPHGAI